MTIFINNRNVCICISINKCCKNLFCNYIFNFDINCILKAMSFLKHCYMS